MKKKTIDVRRLTNWDLKTKWPLKLILIKLGTAGNYFAEWRINKGLPTSSKHKYKGSVSRIAQPVAYKKSHHEHQHY